MRKTLYIVDAHSLIFQVFHAIPEMSAPDGRPTNAVFGFSRDLFHILEDKKPDYFICAFDAPGATFRDTLFPQYKAGRAAMPDNLRPQLEMIREVVDAMGILSIEHAGFEADDVLATVVRQALDRQIDTFICSGDKDTRQLLGPHVSIYNIRKNEVFDAKSLEAQWGIRPEQVVDLLAITGDSIDNVPGVAGIGPKTASALLNQFGSLDGILSNLHQITGRKREGLEAGQEMCRQARVLVTLRDDVPINVNWDDAATGRLDGARLATIFNTFGFRKLAAQFASHVPPAAPWEGTYRAVTTESELQATVAELSAQRRFAFDLITTEAHPLLGRLAGIALAWKPGEAHYIPIRAPVGDQSLREQRVLEALRPLFESDRYEKVGHDVKHDLVSLGQAGIELEGLLLDTMIADYLMEAGERTHTLDQLAQRYLRHTPVLPDEVFGSGTNKLSPDRVSVSQLTRHAGELSDVAWRVIEVQEAKLREEGLWELFETVETPLIRVLASMEMEGIYVDRKTLEQMSHDFAQRLEQIERQIYELAGGEFNIGSPIQLRTVLFDRLRLPVIKKTKTGPSTDQEVLEALAPQHPLPKLLIEHRQIAKLKSTYVDALPKLIHPETGRVHATFHQAVAATGRLSSSEPNLQNIPIRSELGRQIRQAFQPGRASADLITNASKSNRQPGPWLILTADYSQVELRILAHLSDDAELRRAFENDQDIHTFVASQIYAVPADAVQFEMRQVAKMVNFGVVYGLSPFGLATRLGIGKEEAEAFITAYFAKYRGVEEFIAQVLRQAHREGCVTTMLGRRRRIAGVRAKVGHTLNQSEREAVNTVVQGSAADLIKMAMIRLHERFPRDRLAGKLLLQIHDELLFEIPASELRASARAVAEEMIRAMDLKVPLKVDLAAGPNWRDVDSIDVPLDLPLFAGTK